MKEFLHKQRVLKRMALRMRNAGMYKAFASWESAAEELKREAAVVGKQEETAAEVRELAVQLDSIRNELTSSKDLERKLTKNVGEVSSQLAMSQREVLRMRKEVECARADEQRAVRDANVVLDELRKNECLYKLQLQQDLQNISLELKMCQKVTQDLGISFRVASVAQLAPKASLRLSLQGIKLAAKDGKSFLV